jgi:hypothetical protein
MVWTLWWAETSVLLPTIEHPAATGCTVSSLYMISLQSRLKREPMNGFIHSVYLLNKCSVWQYQWDFVQPCFACADVSLLNCSCLDIFLWSVTFLAFFKTATSSLNSLFACRFPLLLVVPKFWSYIKCSYELQCIIQKARAYTVIYNFVCR